MHLHWNFNLNSKQWKNQPLQHYYQWQIFQITSKWIDGCGDCYALIKSVQGIKACATLYLLQRIHISTSIIEFNIFDGKSTINTRKSWGSEVGLECYSLSLAKQFLNWIGTIWRTSGSDKHAITLLFENSTEMQIKQTSNSLFVEQSEQHTITYSVISSLCFWVHIQTAYLAINIHISNNFVLKKMEMRENKIKWLLLTFVMQFFGK